MDLDVIYNDDALKTLKILPDESINCCVTSPPYYGLRDYGVNGQLGIEETPELYISNLADVFDEVKRVLRDDGTLWLNIGDSYAGSGKGAWDNKSIQRKETYRPSTDDVNVKMPKTWDGIKSKDLIGIPWMLAFELRRRGWYLRQDIIWAKPNPMPESVKDRCTKSHEHIFLLSKSRKYYFDAEAISEPVAESTLLRLGKNNGNIKSSPPRFGGNKYTKDQDIHNRTKSGNEYDYKPRRNKRDVWFISTKPYKGAHFATFPPDLIEPCILAGCPKNGVVLDPFFGSGTTGLVAKNNNRHYIGIDLNENYCSIAIERCS